ncbi:E3 ubiquitin-protein ligase MARCHF5-like [Pollicipes pollicipes]|uniref:E3 ubiquitin-protein ligase MARCHF5-like n=1 Tax=Pollicipes pollicipes TaxID=41117 RepID=UPI001885485E|nr:E3 ubiquitin-protein ligase MARCHF5-like [Pollicipes pollicipes]
MATTGHPRHVSKSSSTDNEENRRNCWVCFASDEDDRMALWVKPCRCRGTTKWVHQSCLQRWVDEKQQGNAMAPVRCPQCNTEYVILFPQMGPVVMVMDLIDEFISRSCPFVAAGVVVGSVYWTAVTFGAVTVMQVVGHRDGLAAMEQADPIFLLVGLPTIPLLLIMGKMVRWEDAVLRFLRSSAVRLPLLKRLMPAAPPLVSPAQPYVDTLPLNDPVSATRVLCGALLFPTVATLAGRALFESVPSRLQRTLLGAAAFVCVKGALKIYHKHKQLIRLSLRQVLNFDDENAVRVRQSGASRPEAANDADDAQ